ncbi:M23 family metallopeptidase [Sphingomonas sp. ID0503]|uniref:M23 family metallopeptidase n=1 Tax=Sphingomonas sp. ID0503 TaxID=3399691 RepID=UPI003AFB60B4
MTAVWRISASGGLGLYQQNNVQFGSGAAAATLSLETAIGPIFGRPTLRPATPPRHAWNPDLTVDLGVRIGSLEWWRGLATCTALCASAWALGPTFHPLTDVAPITYGSAERDELAATSIAPLGLGADIGRHAAGNALVEPLAETPERPQVEMSATLGLGDGFARVLERNGVSSDEAAQVAKMVTAAVPLSDIKSGTKLDITLGRRPNKKVARPLDTLAFRAKFELSLAVERVNGVLRLRRIPIAVDNTPLRVQGRVGSGLYIAARNAGAPARAVEAYIKAIGSRLSIGRDVRADDRFDLIVTQRRAATGEVETGNLVFAGLNQGSKKIQMVRWEQDGRTQWFEASGVGETRGQMRAPVVGRLTSSFGLRRHPLLGFSRMHKGVDYGAPSGAPIVAATDGVVAFSGWHGGHGNYVRLSHAGGLATGYGHMSRIVARAGQRVRMGQLIGYVGSTGLSTGPHLHYELYKNGAAINPTSVKFTTRAQLAGAELAKFRSTLARLLSTRVGGSAPVKTADAKVEPEAKKKG